MATLSGLVSARRGGPLPYLPRPGSPGLPCTCTRPHQTSQDAPQHSRALQRWGSLWVGIGCSQRGSGSLWLHPVALGRAAGSSPLWSVRAGLYSTLHISVSREAHEAWATVSNARADVSSLALVEIPIQLGMAMIAREGQGRLPLFLYLFGVAG